MAFFLIFGINDVHFVCASSARKKCRTKRATPAHPNGSAERTARPGVTSCTLHPKRAFPFRFPSDHFTHPQASDPHAPQHPPFDALRGQRDASCLLSTRMRTVFSLARPSFRMIPNPSPPATGPAEKRLAGKAARIRRARYGRDRAAVLTVGESSDRREDLAHWNAPLQHRQKGSSRRLSPHSSGNAL